MSEEVDVQGHWWLPGHEEGKVAGNLTFNSREGGSLILNGGLSGPLDGTEMEVAENGETRHLRTLGAMERAGTYPRILGEAEGKAMTLDDCVQREARGSMLGLWSREVVTVNRLYCGVHFEPGEVAGANKLSVRLACLDDWALEEYIQEEQTYAPPGRTLRSATLKVEPRDARSVLLNSGSTIRLEHIVGWEGRRETKRSLTQGYVLSLERPSVEPIRSLTEPLSVGR